MALKSHKTKHLKPKPIRKSRSEQYLVNFKYLGDEPDSNFKTMSEQIRAFNWYNSMCDMGEAREYLKDYLTAVDRTDLTKRLDRVSDTFFPTTAAWMARIAQRRSSLIESQDYDKFMGLIEHSISHVKEEKAETKKVDKPSIQDRMKDREYDIIGDIEAMLDTNQPFSVYDYLKKNEVPATYSNRIIEYYEPLKDEYYEAIFGPKEMAEGYEHYKKGELKERLAQVLEIIEDAEKYGSVTKKIRAPRKQKPVSADKVVKNLKYQKESNEHKIASINPTSIIGAKTLWTFNTKYNSLSVFNAIGPAGLNVRGSTVLDFDDKTSKTLKIGRKTDEKLEAVLKGGKIVQKKLMEEMRPIDNGRINENTILLKVSR